MSQEIFLTRMNGILANFNYCDLQTKYRIFVSYCTLYYGSCLWDLQHVFYTTWRKAIRRLFGLPRNAHCNLLPLVAACLPIQSQLLNRGANFVNSCLRASKLKDHKIGRSPYFKGTKSGDFLRKLFKALPKTIGLPGYGSPSALYTFYLGIASKSNIIKPGDDNDICHFYASRYVHSC